MINRSTFHFAQVGESLAGKMIVYIFFAAFMGLMYSTVNLIQIIQTLCVFIILKYIFRI